MLDEAGDFKVAAGLRGKGYAGRPVDGTAAYWTRLAVATAAAALLLLDLLSRRTKGALRLPASWPRLRDGLLVVLTVGIGGTWLVDVGRSTVAIDIHTHDFFHYYIGSKYFPELRYARIYECVVVADAQAGRRDELSKYAIRDLATNRMQPVGPILEDPSRCKRHFQPARWREFRRDVGWLRARLPPRFWAKMRADHGYNAPPAFGLVASPLANTAPLSPAQIRALTLLDPLLVLAAFGAVVWAFGWRTACVAFLFWATNYPARWQWIGGSFLRESWLAASVVGVALLRKERPAWAGLAFAYATALRIFPAFLLLGVAVKAAFELWRRRRVDPAHLRLGASYLASCVLLAALSSAAVGDAQSWLEFVDNSRKHLSTPLTNHVGLSAVVSYDHSQRSSVLQDPFANDDPLERWAVARAQTADDRRLVFLALAAAFAGLFVYAASREGQPDWVVVCLGAGAIVIGLELTSYYWAILLVFGLLWPRDAPVGFGLLLLAAAGWWLSAVPGGDDTVYAAQSAAAVVFVVFATWMVASRSRSE